MFSDSVCCMWQDILKAGEKNPLCEVCIQLTFIFKTGLTVICHIYNSSVNSEFYAQNLQTQLGDTL